MSDKQPSADISAAKAKQILKDGEVHGKPLTDKQRGMFGAAAQKNARYDDQGRKVLTVGGVKEISPEELLMTYKPETLRNAQAAAMHHSQPELYFKLFHAANIREAVESGDPNELKRALQRADRYEDTHQVEISEDFLSRSGWDVDDIQHVIQSGYLTHPGDRSEFNWPPAPKYGDETYGPEGDNPEAWAALGNLGLENQEGIGAAGEIDESHIDVPDNIPGSSEMGMKPIKNQNDFYGEGSTIGNDDLFGGTFSTPTPDQDAGEANQTDEDFLWHDAGVSASSPIQDLRTPEDTRPGYRSSDSLLRSSGWPRQAIAKANADAKTPTDEPQRNAQTDDMGRAIITVGGVKSMPTDELFSTYSTDMLRRAQGVAGSHENREVRQAYTKLFHAANISRAIDLQSPQALQDALIRADRAGVPAGELEVSPSVLAENGWDRESIQGLQRTRWIDETVTDEDVENMLIPTDEGDAGWQEAEPLGELEQILLDEHEEETDPSNWWKDFGDEGGTATAEMPETETQDPLTMWENVADEGASLDDFLHQTIDPQPSGGDIWDQVEPLPDPKFEDNPDAWDALGGEPDQYAESPHLPLGGPTSAAEIQRLRDMGADEDYIASWQQYHDPHTTMMRRLSPEAKDEMRGRMESWGFSPEKIASSMGDVHPGVPSGFEETPQQYAEDDYPKADIWEQIADFLGGFAASRKDVKPAMQPVQPPRTGAPASWPKGGTVTPMQDKPQFWPKPGGGVTISQRPDTFTRPQQYADNGDFSAQANQEGQQLAEALSGTDLPVDQVFDHVEHAWQHFAEQLPQGEATIAVRDAFYDAFIDSMSAAPV